MQLPQHCYWHTLCYTLYYTAERKEQKLSVFWRREKTNYLNLIRASSGSQTVKRGLAVSSVYRSPEEAQVKEKSEHKLFHISFSLLDDKKMTGWEWC